MATATKQTAPIDDQLLGELNHTRSPDELLRAIFERFGPRAAIGTSGQLTGSVLIDMASKTGLPFRVFAIDTLRLHPETYELWNRIEKRYRISIERFRPDPSKLEKMIRDHGEFLFFDSKAKQEFCCELRKVEPNQRALATLDAWVTGLRQDQSEYRKGTPRLEIIQEKGRSLLKACPVVEWNEQQVRAYIQKHDVPYNPLFDPQSNGARYTSLGCIICTTPVLPHEPPRAGRWRWFNVLESDKKECGIHVKKSQA